MRNLRNRTSPLHKREHWRDASAIRRIFRAAFTRAGLPYYNPHRLRRTVALFGEKLPLTPEGWKAYSQNFGHSSPMTTYDSYGTVTPERQREILQALSDEGGRPDAQARVAVRLDDDQLDQIIGQLGSRINPAGAGRGEAKSE